MTVGTFHDMSPMSSEPPPRLSRTGPVQLGADLERQPLLAAAELLLQRLGERLVGLAPLRHPDLLDVGARRFGDGLVEVLRPGAAEHPRRLSSVPVIIAAPLAIASPISHSSLIFG